nr:hypothetical protein 21 [bacterium]
MARTGFKIPGLTAYVNRVRNVIAQETAELMISELQDDGPAYTGEFRNAWEAVPRLGARIPADRESKYTDFLDRLTAPTEPKKDIQVPPLKGRAKTQGYTIGNRMEYRNIALDLDPEKWRTTPPKTGNTADRDWYLTFVQGGKLNEILRAGTDQAAKNPKVRGFNANSRTTRS